MEAIAAETPGHLMLCDDPFEAPAPTGSPLRLATAFSRTPTTNMLSDLLSSLAQLASLS